MTSFPLITIFPVSASLEDAFGHDIVQMIIHAGFMVKFVLLVLLVFSVISWAIILVKYRLFGKAKKETLAFLELFWEERDLKKIYDESEEFKHSPVALIFRAGYAELNRIRKLQAQIDSKGSQTPAKSYESLQSQKAVMENIERSLKRATVEQAVKLERAISFLATTGNAAPFIGLFGTVWGIMESFRGIGMKGSANLAVVAPGISEALIATAAGLAAAIPAVVAFNYFTNRYSSLRVEMDIFSSDFLSTIERQFFKKKTQN